MTITVRIEGMDGLQRKLDDPEFVAGPLHEFLEKAGHQVEYEAKELAPVDIGRLKASIKTRVSKTKAIIGPLLKYAPFVEFGTKPHFPPPDALQPWARRHGFGKRGHYALAHAIAKRGTRAHPFMVPGFEAARARIEGFLKELGAALEKKWGK